MQESLLQELNNLRPTIARRWEVLLRSRPVASPLANPDSLIYLMDWTFNQFIELLRKGGLRRRQQRSRAQRLTGTAACETGRLGCVCGKNPLLAYFQTAELAIIDTMIPLLDPLQRELPLMEISSALRQLAIQEVETFCAVCKHRQESPKAVEATEASVR